MIDVESETRWV